MEREEGDRWLLAITCPLRQLVRENHVFPDELLLKSRLWLRGWIVSCACWPGLRGMYIETHLMRLSESRSAFTRGDFHLSSHHCGFLISKGLCCKHILFFQRALLTRRGLQCSLPAKRGHLELSEWRSQQHQSRHWARVCGDVFWFPGHIWLKYGCGTWKVCVRRC